MMKICLSCALFGNTPSFVIPESAKITQVTAENAKATKSNLKYNNANASAADLIAEILNDQKNSSINATRPNATELLNNTNTTASASLNGTEIHGNETAHSTETVDFNATCSAPGATQNRSSDSNLTVLPDTDDIDENTAGYNVTAMAESINTNSTQNHDIANNTNTNVTALPREAQKNTTNSTTEVIFDFDGQQEAGFLPTSTTRPDSAMYNCSNTVVFGGKNDTSILMNNNNKINDDDKTTATRSTTTTMTNNTLIPPFTPEDESEGGFFSNFTSNFTSNFSDFSLMDLLIDSGILAVTGRESGYVGEMRDFFASLNGTKSVNNNSATCNNNKTVKNTISKTTDILGEIEIDADGENTIVHENNSDSIDEISSSNNTASSCTRESIHTNLTNKCKGNSDGSFDEIYFGAQFFNHAPAPLTFTRLQGNNLTAAGVRAFEVAADDSNEDAEENCWLREKLDSFYSGVNAIFPTSAALMKQV